MGTPVRPQLPSSSKKTKASYAMISNFSNVRSTFLLYFLSLTFFLNFLEPNTAYKYS